MGIGAASVLALVESDNPRLLAISGTALLGLVSVYGILIHAYEEDTVHLGDSSQKPMSMFIRAIASRTAGVLAFLAVILLFVWLPDAPLTFKTFAAGSLKAVHWIIVFWIVSDLTCKL
jgi:hypothetical protein